MVNGWWRHVVVYVEGKSDQQALTTLLAPLLERCAANGTRVDFIPLEGKARLMGMSPGRAVNILRNNPNAVVVALPDLYPPNIGGPHSTDGELRKLLTRGFRTTLRSKVGDERMATRFHVHCLKYDLEALLLAAPDALAAHLGVEAVPVTWTVPVEDHNHGDPPKRVVERIFAQHNQIYQAAVDAPLILRRADCARVVEACQQSFKPLVELFESFCTG